MLLKFTQLSGDRRTLELAGHAAPFGRSRVGAVAVDSITLRESEVFVAGSDQPVRHVHGIKHGPWEMNGRFQDVYGGDGFALAKTSEVKRFVAEMQPVRASWGDSLAALGLITSFEPGRESERDVPWKMTVRIDSDELIEQRIEIPKQRRPKDYVNQILLFSTEVQEAFKGMKLRGSVFDALNSLISSLASITGFAVAISNELQSFESEFIGSLRRFRATLGQLKTAAVSVRDTVDAFSVDLAIQENNANEQLGFLRGQAIVSDSTLSIIKEAGEADRRAQLAEQGRILAIYDARGGDTFESISTFYYGSAARAKNIRAANGVAEGQPPIAGETYIIPV